MADYPVTQAIRHLKKYKIEFVPHQYNYQEKGGTAQTADELNVNEHDVVKTLVFEDNTGKLLLVLMHGDMEVSAKQLARETGVKSVAPADPKKASKATGYLFGGTSPFGTKQNLKVYAQVTIFDSSVIYINGGKQGFILEMKPEDLEKALDIEKIDVAQ